MKAKKTVLVTTKHKGVFFGNPVGDITPEKAVLKNARCVVYWPAENKGFMGLAAHGPLPGARVGPPVNITLFEITSAAECTPLAIERLEKFVW